MNSSGLPTDIDPVDVAIEMLTVALPGFESRFVAARDAVGIRGALPIAAEVSRELILYPIYRSPVFMSDGARRVMDAHESEADRLIRHARQREVLTHELAPIVAPIVEKIQRLAIDAVGLEPVIAERERRAREDGRSIGMREGRADGMREGYLNGVRSIVRTLLQSEADFGEAVDRVREEWGGDLDD